MTHKQWLNNVLHLHPVHEEGAGTRTNNKLNPHTTPSPGIEPGHRTRAALVGGECSTAIPLRHPCSPHVRSIYCFDFVFFVLRHS